VRCTAWTRSPAGPPRPGGGAARSAHPPPPVGGIWEFRWIAVRVRRRFPAVPRVGWPKSNNITVFYGGLFSVVHAHGYTRKPNTG